MFTSRDSVGIQGIGQAACPSQMQAAGIVDCTDPCQASSAACSGIAPAATATAATAAGNVVLTPAQFANINTQNYTQGQLNPVSTSATCPAGATCSIISGVSDTTIYIAGGILGALLLFMTMSGGGRRR
jgi:hypothetical protein